MKRPYLIPIVIIAAMIAIGIGIVNQAQPRPYPQASFTPDPAEGGRYLYISDWGVRFKLPEQLKGKVMYTTRNGTDVSLPASANSTTNGDIAYLTTHEFAALPQSNCNLDTENSTPGARVLIFRTTQNQPPYDAADVRLAGYNYVASAGNGGFCSPTSDQVSELEFIHQIVNAYKSMEVVK